MNLQKCSNGHYYDGDVYSSCPHCKNQQASEGKTVALDVSPSGGGDVTVAHVHGRGPHPVRHGAGGEG